MLQSFLMFLLITYAHIIQYLCNCNVKQIIIILHILHNHMCTAAWWVAMHLVEMFNCNFESVLDKLGLEANAEVKERWTFAPQLPWIHVLIWILFQIYRSVQPGSQCAKFGLNWFSSFALYMRKTLCITLLPMCDELFFKENSCSISIIDILK